MPRDRESLLDILDAARLACQYLADKGPAQWAEDIQCQDAVVRRLEIIGEAARRLSTEVRTQHPEVPWSVLVGMRNVMIHEYDSVDLEVVWKTVKDDPPQLINQLEKFV